MTVSMRKMAPGTGYRYLLSTVAAGDGNRSLTSPLTRYYAESGTPPGRWMGSGLETLGDGQIALGSEVRESQLALLIGMGRDPVTGDQLGRAYPSYNGAQSNRRRVASRIAEIPPETSEEDRAALIATIEAEEVAAGHRRAVAGFDYTFSVPKSVSVLWGVAGGDMQAEIVEAHHAAVAEVVAFIEREVAATRAGVSNDDGAVAQVGVDGVIAAGFDHWDSRSGDPQLHTHVVISNKVRAQLDGRWRSLDSRPMHAAVVALSAHYDAILADELATRIGVGWEQRQRGSDRKPRWEIAGVNDGLINEFSGRTREIERTKGQLIAAYVDRHGRQPSKATIVKLRAQATLATRPEKVVRSLADLTREWRERAGARLGRDASSWARSTTWRGSDARESPAPQEMVAELAERVVEEVSAQRSTWRHWNLWAEASRLTMGRRFASAEDREVFIAHVVEAAKRGSVALTPAELAPSPTEFQRGDGTSVFRPRHSTVFSSTELLAAEGRLLDLAEDLSAPSTWREPRVAGLGEEQVSAIRSISLSGRRLDLLVGAAGAGKTTTMRALRDHWVRCHGEGSVVGLAPSAAAAHVLGGDLGVRCENTAKWLHEHAAGREFFHRGQLVIIDEATLADTRSLDRLTAAAAIAGAKVLLVGDPAQLQSVDAGGAFAMLVAARPDVATLTELHRFTHDWEKAATLLLRDGKPEAITVYDRHQRIHDGTTEEMLDAAYAAWKADVEAGRDSVLVTESIETVDSLNLRARADRLLRASEVPEAEVVLARDSRASVGDLVITRRNDRTLRTRQGDWVRNGDRWTVIATPTDGGLTLCRIGDCTRGTLDIPADYVAKHVDLGYAVTAHRAQGITVDTAHVLVSARTSRENLYVSMSRGRSSNIAHVALDDPDDRHEHVEDGDISAFSVMDGVLRRTGVEMAAHQSVIIEQNTWSSVAQLAAEYETIAAAAQHDLWSARLSAAGLSVEQVAGVVASPSFGALISALRRIEASGRPIMDELKSAIDRHQLADAEDIGAVLHERLRVATSWTRRPSHGDFVVGLFPRARGEMSSEHEAALLERERLISVRAASLAVGAAADRHGWVARLGSAPLGASARRAWASALVTVAAYRDRYGITGAAPLGAPPRSQTQRTDLQRAHLAARSVALAAKNDASVPIAGASVHRWEADADPEVRL